MWICESVSVGLMRGSADYIQYIVFHHS